MAPQSASDKLKPWNASALGHRDDNSEYKEHRQQNGTRFSSKLWVPKNQTMRPWNVAAVMNTESQPGISSPSQPSEFNYIEERQRLQQEDRVVHDTITPHELNIELVADSDSFFHVQNVVSNAPTLPISPQDLRSPVPSDTASQASSSRRKRSAIAEADLLLARAKAEKAKLEVEMAKRAYEVQLAELHARQLRAEADDEDDEEL